MRTCLNCNNVVFKSEKDSDEKTKCSKGYWEWGGNAICIIMQKNSDGCADWELLESLRGKRGTKTEW